jgi:hypothetical protein
VGRWLVGHGAVRGRVNLWLGGVGGRDDTVSHGPPLVAEVGYEGLVVRDGDHSALEVLERVREGGCERASEAMDARAVERCGVRQWGAAQARHKHKHGAVRCWRTQSVVIQVIRRFIQRQEVRPRPPDRRTYTAYTCNSQ